MSNNKLIGTIAGNRYSIGYLAVCAVLLLWAVGDATLVDHEDGSFAAVIPLLATAPVSMAALALPDGWTAGLFVASAVGAVVNAWLISKMVGAKRRSTVSA
ncbi:SCO4225 family membrane protein [Streptomyces sp. NPDC087844]|uniref:SCO4225 family membrane protein n=1 Tax=Streptomyces sp. NPDC087844 TaxID=3365805 RepID=UPI0037F56C2E